MPTGHLKNDAPYRFDVKLTAGKTALDPPMGTEFGIVTQHPVYVFTKEHDTNPRKTLEHGSEEYFIQKKTWFGTSSPKARMYVHEYKVDDDDS